MSGQELFNAAIAFLSVCGIPLLLFFWNRIKESKTEAVKEALDAIAGPAATANEAKRLAIDALDKHNAHKLHVAENYISVKRFEGFEAALFKKLDTIEAKLDLKQDKE